MHKTTKWYIENLHNKTNRITQDKNKQAMLLIYAYLHLQFTLDIKQY